MDSFNIRTDASDLVDIVGRHGEISLDDLAKQMDMSRSGLISLIKILEKSKLLKSKHSLNGNIKITTGERFNQINVPTEETKRELFLKTFPWNLM